MLWHDAHSTGVCVALESVITFWLLNLGIQCLEVSLTINTECDWLTLRPESHYNYCAVYMPCWFQRIQRTPTNFTLKFFTSLSKTRVHQKAGIDYNIVFYTGWLFNGGIKWKNIGVQSVCSVTSVNRRSV